MKSRVKAEKVAADTADDATPDEIAQPPLNISEYYQPFPRQAEFHSSNAKYRLFGGAAGPGKTKALLWEAIRQANRYPRVDTLLLRRTFPELETSLINYFRRDVPRDIYKSYNDTKHVVTWHNGSTTRFGYSAGENDIYQYQGAEFLFIGIDELTLFTLGQWQFLTSRNRCSVPGTFPNMAGASNPGNVGHAWVKALWVDRRPAPGMDSPQQYDARDYDFIRATLADNPIYKDDADYRKTLEALPRHLRQSFLHGDWDVFAGQYFDIFDVRRHVARAEQIGRSRDARPGEGRLIESRLIESRGEGIAPWWPRWISIDWGFEHPSAVYWHAAEPGGGVVTYREFVANHLSPRMLAQAIAERSRGFNNDERTLGTRTDSPYLNRAVNDYTEGAEYRSEAFPGTANLRIGAVDTPLPGQPRQSGDWRSQGTPHAHSYAADYSASLESDVILSGAKDLSGGGYTDTAGEILRSVRGLQVEPAPGSTPQNDNGRQGGHNYAERGRVANYDEPRRGANGAELRRGAISLEHIGNVYLSPDAFARRTSESTIAEQLGDVLSREGLPRPIPADDDRIGGWMLMYQMLEEGQWVITDNCARLIECLPTLVRDPANVEDVFKCNGDDPADSARYGLKSRLSPGRMPAEQRVAQRIEAAGAQDPTSRAIWAQKFMAEERRARRSSPLPHRW